MKSYNYRLKAPGLCSSVYSVTGKRDKEEKLLDRSSYFLYRSKHFICSQSYHLAVHIKRKLIPIYQRLAKEEKKIK